MYDIDKTPLGWSLDVFMHEESLSLGFSDSALPNPLHHSHISPLWSLPSPFTKYYIDAPINNLKICDANMDLGHKNNMFSMLGGNFDGYVSRCCFRGYDPPINLYCARVEGLYKKIIWTAFFNTCYDYSKAFNKIKRILIVVFGVTLVIASCLVFSKLWS